MVSLDKKKVPTSFIIANSVFDLFASLDMKLLAAVNKDKFFSVLVLFKEVSWVEREGASGKHTKFSQWYLKNV